MVYLENINPSQSYTGSQKWEEALSFLLPKGQWLAVPFVKSNPPPLLGELRVKGLQVPVSLKTHHLQEQQLLGHANNLSPPSSSLTPHPSHPLCFPRCPAPMGALHPTVSILTSPSSWSPRAAHLSRLLLSLKQRSVSIQCNFPVCGGLQVMSPHPDVGKLPRSGNVLSQK